MSKISKKQAVAQLWEKGVLHWKLYPVQKEMYDMYKNSDQKIVTWLCSRRIGKSYSLAVIAAEACLQNKNCIVKFLCPTAKMLKQLLIPIFREILEDCPPSVKPEFIASENKYRFANGSEIHLAGSDNGRAENLRGAYANLCIVDEAGFCEDLGYTVRSVLKPLVLTTRGKIILSSTPPRTNDHEFIGFIKKAEADGTLIKKTIFDNKTLTPNEIQQEIASYPGGMQNPEFRREYLAELVMDKDILVFPEFTEDVQSRTIQEWTRPPFYDYYVSADIGYIDYTAVLFGYLDFKSAKFIIEDEIVLNKMTTKTLADEIKAKEAKLLTMDSTGEQKAPHLRVSDNNLIVINDLYRLHGLNFMPTAKDDRDSAINNLRILFASEKIIIHPRCKFLINHVKNASWNKAQKRDLARAPEGGHYDTAMALVYLMRNVQWNRSPYPKGYDITDHANRYQFKDPKKGAFETFLANTFKVKKST